MEDALSAEDVRPLTDQVIVSEAQPVIYRLYLLYSADSGAVVPAITQAVTDYQEWQDNTIGRAFNPDRLMAAVYQAGATRVQWGEGSVFDDGEVCYTEINIDQHCKGTITITSM